MGAVIALAVVWVFAARLPRDESDVSDEERRAEAGLDQRRRSSGSAASRRRSSSRRCSSCTPSTSRRPGLARMPEPAESPASIRQPAPRPRPAAVRPATRVPPLGMPQAVSAPTLPPPVPPAAPLGRVDRRPPPLRLAEPPAGDVPRRRGRASRAAGAPRGSARRRDPRRRACAVPAGRSSRSPARSSTDAPVAGRWNTIEPRLGDEHLVVVVAVLAVPLERAVAPRGRAQALRLEPRPEVARHGRSTGMSDPTMNVTSAATPPMATWRRPLNSSPRPVSRLTRRADREERREREQRPTRRPRSAPTRRGTARAG